jgi:membrane protease YdiL (CAAX protease family)
MRIAREEGSTRLRASLRGILPAVATLALFLVGGSLLGTIAESVTAAGSIDEVLLKSLVRLVLYLALIAAAVWSAATLERRTDADVGLDVDADWLRTFAVGTAVSLVGVAASLWWGDVRGLREVDRAAAGVRGPDEPVVLGLAFGAFVCYFLLGNVYEEVVYRRIVLGNFVEGLTARGVSPKVAVVLATVGSLLLFGAYHVPLRGNFVVAIDAALMGIPFALAYLLTGELGLPVGLHFGRISIEFAHGLTLGEFEVLAIVELTRNALAANLEVKLVQLGLVCLLVLAWVYRDRGELRFAESVS